MEQPKIERLLQLIMMMASKTDHTIEDIARRLGTTPRSVYRYIETLRNTGFAIDKRKSNLYKILRIPNSSISLRNLVYFSQEEAHLVNSLIHNLEGTNSLKATLQKKLSVIYNCTNMADLVVNGNTAKHIEALGNAIRSRKQVILHDYESAHSHTVSNRHIEPFAFTTNYIDIWAYDLEKHENRVFKVSRIGSVEMLQASWSNEECHKQANTDCFRMNGSQTHRVKLALSLRAKNLLIEEYPLAIEGLKEKSGEWHLETDVYDLAGVGRFVLGLAGDVTIIDSPELEEYVSSYIQEHLVPYIRKSETNGPALNVFTTE